jgi:DNA-binding transcriptional MerR regulator
MTSTVSVGRFATMTHLSVKTLRHYHQVGLLEPAEVDPHTGYRYYALEQLPTAQLIRRLRDLRMPVADVRAVLVASSPSERDTLIAAHIDHLEAELAQTQAAVKSLRALLECAPGQQHPVHRRAESSFPVLAITEDTLDPADVESWWREALHELRAAADDRGMQVTGRPAAFTTNAFSNTNPVKPPSTSPSPRHANWAGSNRWLFPPPRSQ